MLTTSCEKRVISNCPAAIFPSWEVEQQAKECSITHQKEGKKDEFADYWFQILTQQQRLKVANYE